MAGDITKQLELLCRRFLEDTEIDSAIHEMLTILDTVSIKQVGKTTITNFLCKKQSSGNENLIQVHEISNYQFNKFQLNDTNLQEIERKVAYLLKQFNQNKLGLRSF